MAEAGQKHTPPFRYNKEDWAGLKKFVEKETRQKLDKEKEERCRSILESAVTRYVWSIAFLTTKQSRLSPEDQIEKWGKRCEWSDALLQDLNDDDSVWLISETSITRHSFVSGDLPVISFGPGSPEERFDLRLLIEQLTLLRKRSADSANDLQRFRTEHRRIRNYDERDCVAELRESAFRIGRELLNFDPGYIGGSGPLVQLVHLALAPALGDNSETDADALHQFAVRQNKKNAS
jgi:hypothetical protein